jgi:hypothetical protein
MTALSTPAATPPPAASAKGSPAILIILIVVLGPALALGTLVGAGPAAIIGGFVALFTLIATMGASLRSDLRRLAFVGPLIAFGAVVPRLVAEFSIPAAIALCVAVVLVAGLLPLGGRRYDAVALGIGMGTLFGYSMPIGSFQPWQLALAAVTGIVVAALLRLLLGASDPSGAPRKAAAALLDGTGDDFTAAFDLWATDRPAKWLGGVLIAAGRYQLARRILSERVDPDGSGDAAELLTATAADLGAGVVAGRLSRRR